MNDETLEWLRSHQDPNELARALIESDAMNLEDVAILALWHRGAVGDGEYSARLRALMPPPPKRLPRWFRQRMSSFSRTRKFNKATWPPVPGFKQADEPEQADGDLPPQAPLVALTIDERARLLAPTGITFDRPALHPVSVLDSGIEDMSGKPYRPVTPFRSVNPFRSSQPPTPKLMKSSDLQYTDALNLYSGLSFAMWQHGAVMNAHVIIIWSMMGIDEEEGARRLGKYLSEAQKWLRVGTQPRYRRIKNPRAGEEMHYAWVHENAPGRGFHSHVLMNVPKHLRNDFAQWSRECLFRHNKRRHFDQKAFRFVPSYAKSREDGVWRHWRWFQYLMKQLPPTIAIGYGTDLQSHNLRGLLKPWRHRPSNPVPATLRMAAVSHSIGATARANEGFISLLDQGGVHLSDLYSGDEFIDREFHDATRQFHVGDLSCAGFRSKFRH